MKRQKSFENKEGAALYLVPTPIGNMNEVSARTVEILEQADMIACEDTRNSGALLKKLDISRPLISHHEHNQGESVPRILRELENGKKIAVISDAGYPLLSDPGSYLVRSAIDNDYPVISVSGPNAGLDALVASGLDASHFLFYGFLDSRSPKRIRQLEELKQFPWTLIFYEAPHRIEAMLADLLEVFGDRQMTLARELTKMHEEYLRGSISEVLKAAGSLKGEMVVVVEGCPRQDHTMSLEESVQRARQLISEGMKTKEAARTAAKESGFSKNEIYSLLLELKDL